MTILSGYAVDGPRKGQRLIARQGRTVKEDGNDTGFYAYTAAVGPVPSGWKWIETKKKET